MIHEGVRHVKEWAGQLMECSLLGFSDFPPLFSLFFLFPSYRPGYDSVWFLMVGWGLCETWRVRTGMGPVISAWRHPHTARS